MRMLSDLKQIAKPLLLGALALALAAPAGAGTVFAWTTDDGVSAYTNDPKRIPARYKDGARRIQVRDGLASYARYTPRDTAADATYANRVYDRLERLRTLNAHLDASRVAQQTTPAGYETALRLNRRSTIRVQTPMRGDAPIVVDEHRVRSPNRMVTRHVTVVRQGDHVISVIRPKSHSSALSHKDESELYE